MSQAVGASADAKQRNRRARELRHPKNFIKVHKRAKTRKLAETSACFEVYKLYRFIEKSCSGSNTVCFEDNYIRPAQLKSRGYKSALPLS